MKLVYSGIFGTISELNTTQHAIDQLVSELLKRGAHPDDRDSLTDMTLLMYACKAGASGVGSVEAAVGTVRGLVERGAGLAARCRWTGGPPHCTGWGVLGHLKEALF